MTVQVATPKNEVAAVQKFDPHSPAKQGTAMKLLQQQSTRLGKLLPSNVPVERFIEIALSCLMQDPKLQQCSLGSFYGAVVSCAKLGLMPDRVLQQAFILPYKGEAQLQIGYRGYQTLAKRNGAVSTIYAELVYSKDNFELHLGTDRSIKHEPAKDENGRYLPPSRRGELLGAYCIAKFRFGGDPEWIWMPIEDVNKIRDRVFAQRGRKGPWTDDYEAMVLKTPIRHLCSKRLELSPEDMRLAEATERGATFRADPNSNMTDVEIELLDEGDGATEAPPVGTHAASKPAAAPQPADENEHEELFENE